MGKICRKIGDIGPGAQRTKKHRTKDIEPVDTGLRHFKPGNKGLRKKRLKK